MGLTTANMTRTMKATLVRLASIVSICLVSACGQPPQSIVPGAGSSQTALQSGFGSGTARHARYIYFAGIRLARGFLGPGELGVYPATANGNVAPLHVITGRKTGLNEDGGCCVPQSAWFDPATNSVWTCRTFSKFISRFSLNQGARSWGNVKPSDTLLISPKTVSCGAVALGRHRDIVADDINKAFVATWPADSTGSSAPIRKISGSATGLYLPSQITFDGKANYIVSDRCSPPQCSGTYSGEILTFDARANGNVSPLRVLAGAKTKLSEPNRVAFDPTQNMIYAANLATSTIAAYPAGSSGNVAPTIFIHGNKTQLRNPDAIAIDRDGYLYVGNEPIVPFHPQASILVFAPGANGNVAPIQIIAGPKTNLAEVNGISVY